VREDIFAGFMANDSERFLRGEKNLDLLLVERPQAKASLTAWKGTITLKRAIDAHEAKRTAISSASTARRSISKLMKLPVRAISVVRRRSANREEFGNTKS
jgi:hypothetical protein